MKRHLSPKKIISAKRRRTQTAASSSTSFGANNFLASPHSKSTQKTDAWKTVGATKPLAAPDFGPLEGTNASGPSESGSAGVLPNVEHLVPPAEGPENDQPLPENIDESEKARRGQKPSERMNQFLWWGPAALESALKREIGPSNSFTCASCDTSVKGTDNAKLFRCAACEITNPVCLACIKAKHVHHQLHIVEEYCEEGEMRFWRRVSMSTLGSVKWLGHNGEKCPSAVNLKQANKKVLDIIDDDGFHKLDVVFCACQGKDGALAEPLQLIEHGFWPGSWTSPRSAYSIRLLRKFLLLAFTAHVNAEDFVTMLRRLSNNVDPQSVKDRAREFRTAVREFAFLISVKRVDGVPGEKLARGSLVTLCPACPQPNINMDPDWKNVPPHLRFLHALFLCMDGNFRQSLRDKAMDPDDFALTEAAAYFVDKDDFTLYVNGTENQPKDKTTCSKFAAMGLGQRSGVLSGIFGCLCTRHMAAVGGGISDLKKGERFSHVDFTRLSALQPYMELLQHILCYDINCQYAKNLEKRREDTQDLYDQCDSIKTTEPVETIYGVGKMHGHGHTAECQLLFSLYLLPGVAMTDAETLERLWAILNGIATQTREMSQGHRHDTLNFHLGDLNFQRLQKIPEELKKRLLDAQFHFVDAKEVLDILEKTIIETESFGPDVLKAWKEEETEWKRAVLDIKNHKTLRNPYEPEKKTRITQTQALADLKTLPTLASLDGDDLVGAVQRGMKLQRDRCRLIEAHASSFADIKWEHQVDAFMEAYSKWLRDDEPQVRELLLQGERELGNATPATESASPENGSVDGIKPLDELTSSQINLPSTWSEEMRRTKAVAQAVQIELELRKGEANDMLSDVRTQLITKDYLTSQLKKPATTNQGVLTRMQNNVKRKAMALRVAADGYTRARGALQTLLTAREDKGTKDQVMKAFPELQPGDLKPFTVFMGNSAPGISRKTPSWIWGDVSFVEGQTDLKTYLSESVRAHWFRTSALVTRWHEELLLVPEEMRRTVRYHYYFKMKWNTAAKLYEEKKDEKGNDKPDLARAAYCRKQAYRFTSSISQCKRLFGGLGQLKRKEWDEPHFDRLRREAEEWFKQTTAASKDSAGGKAA